jgi:hypothetical protein
MKKILLLLLLQLSPMASAAQTSTFYDAIPDLARQANSICGGASSSLTIGDAELAIIARRAGGGGKFRSEEFSSDLLSRALEIGSDNALEISRLYVGCVHNIFTIQARQSGLSLSEAPATQCDDFACRSFLGCTRQGTRVSCKFTEVWKQSDQWRPMNGGTQLVDDQSNHYPWSRLVLASTYDVSTKPDDPHGARYEPFSVSSDIPVPAEYLFYGIPENRKLLKVVKVDNRKREWLSFSYQEFR